MREAVLNSPLVLGGRRYVRGEKVVIENDDDYEVLLRRGVCEQGDIIVRDQQPVVVKHENRSKKRR